MPRPYFGSNRLHRRTWWLLLLWACIAIFTYVVIIEHRNHALNFLPYVLLLVCPLMHVLMHGRHGHHRSHHHERSYGSESVAKQDTSGSSRQDVSK